MPAFLKVGLLWVLLCALSGCASVEGDGPKRTVITAPKDVSGAKAANRAASEQEKTALLGDVSAESFMSFIGIDYGDSVDDFFALYGQPDTIDTDPDYSFNTGYYLYEEGEAGLEVSWLKDTRKVMTLQVRSRKAVGFVLQRVQDKRLGLLFKHHDVIFDLFGKPDSDHSGNNQYDFEVGGANGDVTFICYDHDSYMCSEIFVQWYY